MRRRAAILFAHCGSAAAALAGPLSVGLPGVAEPPTQGPGGYNPRTGQPLRGVMANDTASFRLQMTDTNGATVNLNSGGQFNVARGPTFTDIGANRNGTSRVVATWDEVIANNRTYVMVLVRLTDINDSFMPPNANNGGVPAFSWRWNFGTANPVNFQSWVTQVNMQSAVVSFSNDLGASYSNGSTVFTSSLPPTWNPGSDPGLDIPIFGDGTNALLLSYEIEVIPAPASFGLLSAAGLFALRRRR